MIRDRVNQTLEVWCGTAPTDDETILEILWITTRNDPTRPHNGIEFQPDGVQDLLASLTSEFAKPGLVRKQIRVLTAASFKPVGPIENVNHLVAAVVGCPNLPSTEPAS